MGRTRSWLTVLAIASPLAVFAITYAPSIGLGFLSDDFRWIALSRIADWRDVVRVFESNTGFYRPLVTLSFSADYALFGMRPFGYGLTNFLLVLLCAVLIARLFHRLGLAWTAAAFGAAIWLLNFHGINMALLWISGRTALLLIAFSVSAALCLIANRPLWTVVFVLLALLSKEEAIVLPVVLLAWSVILGMHRTREDRRTLLIWITGSAIAVTVYLSLRSNAGAFTPATAPPYYRFTADPAVVFRNVLEYFDRACTFAIGTALIARLLLGGGRGRRAVPGTLWLLAVVWFAGGYALTTFLPVRSSLYALLPSMAAALLSASYCESLWQSATESARQRALAAAAIVPLVCMPAYLARNHRWTDLSRFSSNALSDLRPHLDDAAPDAWVVLLDEDRGRRVNLQSAFGTLLADAIMLTAGKPVRVWLEPPLEHGDDAGLAPPCGECPRVTVSVSAGQARKRMNLHDIR